jgi:hypothetical protein
MLFARPLRGRRLQLSIFLVGSVTLPVMAAVVAVVGAAEDVIFYVAVVAYVLYLLSSLLLAFSLAPASENAWPLRYTLSMLPAVLLTSWIPITASWSWNISQLSPLTRQVACILSNTVLCYATAWVLLLMARGLSKHSASMRIAVEAASLAIPMVVWALQVGATLHAESLVSS